MSLHCLQVVISFQFQFAEFYLLIPPVHSLPTQRGHQSQGQQERRSEQM